MNLTEEKRDQQAERGRLRLQCYRKACEDIRGELELRGFEGCECDLDDPCVHCAPARVFGYLTGGLEL